MLLPCARADSQQADYLFICLFITHLFTYLETGSHVAQADLKLAMQLRTILNFRLSFLYLPSAGITGSPTTPCSYSAGDQAQSCMHALRSTLSTEPHP